MNKAAALVTIILGVGGATAGLTSWIWARSQDEALAATRIDQNSQATRAVRQDLAEHIEESTATLAAQTATLRDLGALSLEQAEDQRQILLELVPRSKHRKKSSSLREAESRVRR